MVGNIVINKSFDFIIITITAVVAVAAVVAVVIVYARFDDNFSSYCFQKTS